MIEAMEIIMLFMKLHLGCHHTHGPYISHPDGGMMTGYMETGVRYQLRAPIKERLVQTIEKESQVQN